jgi:hypothetical protein
LRRNFCNIAPPAEGPALCWSAVIGTRRVMPSVDAAAQLCMPRLSRCGCAPFRNSVLHRRS